MISREEPKPGNRVWCIRNTSGDTVYAFGFGIYEGDFPRPGWDHPGELARAEQWIRRDDEASRTLNSVIWSWEQMAANGSITSAEAQRRTASSRQRHTRERARPMRDRVLDHARRSGLNPRILLDSGQTVWGCQCYWGIADEDVALNWADGKTIVEVPVVELTG